MKLWIRFSWTSKNIFFEFTGTSCGILHDVVTLSIPTNISMFQNDWYRCEFSWISRELRNESTKAWIILSNTAVLNSQYNQWTLEIRKICTITKKTSTERIGILYILWWFRLYDHYVLSIVKIVIRYIYENWKFLCTSSVPSRKKIDEDWWFLTCTCT